MDEIVNRSERREIALANQLREQPLRATRERNEGQGVAPASLRSRSGQARRLSGGRLARRL